MAGHRPYEPPKVYGLRDFYWRAGLHASPEGPRQAVVERALATWIGELKQEVTDLGYELQEEFP